MKIAITIALCASFALADDAKDPHAACKAEIDALKTRIDELTLRLSAKDSVIQYYLVNQQADEKKKQADIKQAAIEPAKPKAQAKK